MESMYPVPGVVARARIGHLDGEYVHVAVHPAGGDLEHFVEFAKGEGWRYGEGALDLRV